MLYIFSDSMKFWIVDDLCKPAYGGKQAMSENETKAIAIKLAIFRNRIKLYLTFQNSVGAIMYPWGYKLNATSDEAKYVGE